MIFFFLLQDKQVNYLNIKISLFLESDKYTRVSFAHLILAEINYSEAIMAW
jgi:hypothetical protein